jgi:hypothetical protein
MGRTQVGWEIHDRHRPESSIAHHGEPRGRVVTAFFASVFYPEGRSIVGQVETVNAIGWHEAVVSAILSVRLRCLIFRLSAGNHSQGVGRQQQQARSNLGPFHPIISKCAM